MADSSWPMARSALISASFELLIEVQLLKLLIHLVHVILNASFHRFIVGLYLRAMTFVAEEDS